MHILIAPDKFKGALTAAAAADAIARGISRVMPHATLVQIPIADGGEGTAEAIRIATGGKWRTRPARDPLGREVATRYAWLPNETAVIEMSEASGLWRVAAGERNPLRTSTFGTGQLIADAVDRGARKILVGLGGSATNDAGAGMASALGFQFLEKEGKPLPPLPENFSRIAQIRSPQKLSPSIEIVGLCDVENPLIGPRGASRVFGRQKGADLRMMEQLEAELSRFADIVARDLGCDFRDTPGAGAAGGLGFGLLSFCGAKLRPGFETVAETLRLEEQIRESDLVITGEGSLDAQTLGGKGPVGVAALARRYGKPVVAFAGRVEEHPGLTECFSRTFASTPAGMPLEEAIRHAANLLEARVAEVAPSFFMPRLP